MNFKTCFLLFFCLLTGLVFSQNQHSKSFGFISDNDVFISINQDQYFSNGLTLQYQFLPKTTPTTLAKKIHTLQLGQYLYTPFRAYVPNIVNQDRPFAGYLFADFSVSKYFKDESFLKMTYQLGILGPSSGAETLQKWYHRVFDLPAIAGWQYQIQDQLSVNISALYLKNMGYSTNKLIDFNVFSEAKLGSVFNELSLGFVSRLGFKTLNPIFNSVLFNSNIDNKKTSNSVKECYFFIKPQLTYVAYNATIQGSLFNNNSPLTYGVKPIKAHLQIGLKWTSKRFNYGYDVTYLTKAVDNNRVTAHKYGTITMIYKFK
ncbi:MAG: lipid A deacylase LpxR family protein [Flavobacteriaceae bacterium]|nr:lipid A deacylase LpxR family protein [Flavobacteriaceae bacterium]